jgi:hypothetical protein
VGKGPQGIVTNWSVASKQRKPGHAVFLPVVDWLSWIRKIEHNLEMLP